MPGIKFLNYDIHLQIIDYKTLSHIYKATNLSCKTDDLITYLSSIL
ncbi:hypothetical protein M23134_07171 [Microscilla marina ATCC 23134]|uniref:Uncharacterized protein n=1 Tax=Microscilla marina ATCC 23134 TaxID=313606 RepID=A1ZYZ6_MICM2|nr:hypothetical protein M23134_07171 [Microscilla marina ATCC 23134]